MQNNDKRHVPDHESDPARTPGDGWVGEGGASHLGPATNTGSGRSSSDDEESEDEADDSEE